MKPLKTWPVVLPLALKADALRVDAGKGFLLQ
jgi:hypothetical protein